MGDIHRECWDCLPWLANERLSPTETARITQHLQQCVACQQELETQQRLRDAIRSDDSLVLAPHAGLQRLMLRIDSEERLDAVPLASSEPAPRTEPRTIVRRPWLAIAAALQTVVIGALLGVLWWLSPSYGTLTAVTPPTEIITNGPVLRVVFADTVSVAEVRELLQRIDAQVVDGPSEAGVYTLALRGGTSRRTQPDAALATLRANAGVVFAEHAQVELR